MGGLFSSNSTPSTNERSTNRAPTASYSTYHRPIVDEAPRRTIFQERIASRYVPSDPVPAFNSLRITQRRVTGPELCKRKAFFLELNPYGPTVRFIQRNEYDYEGQQVLRMITNKRNFKVLSIAEIDNPFLEAAYNLKRLQKRQKYQHVEERLLFHGTLRAHLHQICSGNFNWRKCKTHLYGKGVSFSPNCNYAANYSDEGPQIKVMILAKVLIGRSCLGNPQMELPPEGFDTSQKGDDGIVIVKYEDSEFLPLFKIEYYLVHENPRLTKGVRSRGGPYMAD